MAALEHFPRCCHRLALGHRLSDCFRATLCTSAICLWCDFAISCRLPPPALSLTLSGCALSFYTLRVVFSLLSLIVTVLIVTAFGRNHDYSRSQYVPFLSMRFYRNSFISSYTPLRMFSAISSFAYPHLVPRSLPLMVHFTCIFFRGRISP